VSKQTECKQWYKPKPGPCQGISPFKDNCTIGSALMNVSEKSNNTPGQTHTITNALTPIYQTTGKT
jgi:hypothetical protein